MSLVDGLSVPDRRSNDAKLEVILNALTKVQDNVSRLDKDVTQLQTVQKQCCDEMIKEHDADIRTLRDNVKDQGYLASTLGDFVTMQKDINKALSDKVQKLMMFQTGVTTVFTAISIIAGFFGDQIMTIIMGGFAK
jgi:t-SNARE complex subunit (syntaxin)